MAAETVKSDRVTANRFADRLDAGVCQTMTATYTNSGAKDADSIIQMFPVKKDWKILDIVLQWTALDTSRTLDIGDDGDIDRFIDGLDASAAGNASMLTTYKASTLGYKYTADNTIDIKVLGGTLVDGAVITGVLYYVRETDIIES